MNPGQAFKEGQKIVDEQLNKIIEAVDRQKMTESIRSMYSTILLIYSGKMRYNVWAPGIPHPKYNQAANDAKSAEIGVHQQAKEFEKNKVEKDQEMDTSTNSSIIANGKKDDISVSFKHSVEFHYSIFWFDGPFELNYKYEIYLFV